MTGVGVTGKGLGWETGSQQSILGHIRLVRSCQLTPLTIKSRSRSSNVILERKARSWAQVLLVGPGHKPTKVERQGCETKY